LRKNKVEKAAITLDKIERNQSEIEQKTQLMEFYRHHYGATVEMQCYQELSALEFEMALRMRAYERHQYLAATFIQAMWKAYHTRRIMGPPLRKYSRACRYIITFMRGKIDRSRRRVQEMKAAKLLQKYMKGYLV
jgi:hypothetical protein